MRETMTALDVLEDIRAAKELADALELRRKFTEMQETRRLCTLYLDYQRAMAHFRPSAVEIALRRSPRIVV